MSEQVIKDLIRLIGDDPEREGLVDTPARVLRSYNELFAGYKQDPAVILGRDFGLDERQYGGMVVSKNVHFTSFCEHHLLPFSGVAHIAYMPRPNGRVVGISKLARVVAVYAKRLQIQERMTCEIADAIYENLDPMGVGVYISAHHSCMGIRGANQPNAQMITSSLKGNFTKPDVKQEFYNLIGV